MPAALAPGIVKPAIAPNGPEIAEFVIAPLKAEEPDGTEVELAAVFTSEPILAREAPARLPDTASNLPLLAFAGLASLGLAFALRRAPARAK